MTMVPTNSERASSVARWLAVVCLALVCISATAQALHFHPNEPGDSAKHCPICPVLHSTAPLAQSLQFSFALQYAAYLPFAAGISRQSLEKSFALFSRPPPLA